MDTIDFNRQVEVYMKLFNKEELAKMLVLRDMQLSEHDDKEMKNNLEYNWCIGIQNYCAICNPEKCRECFFGKNITDTGNLTFTSSTSTGKVFE